MGSGAHGSGCAPHLGSILDPLKRRRAMGFLSRFRGETEPKEETCPKCKTPVPVAAEECSACGWDLREAYHEPEPAASDRI
jgi:Uncharacterised protein family UPF0547